MHTNKYLTTLAVSLYVVFFLVAFWSILPSSVSGIANAPANVMEHQLIACQTGTAEAQDRQESGLQSEQEAGGSSGTLFGSWRSTWNRDSYPCALFTGASYN